ncbi:hypothetical protein V4P56_02210 [Bartonella sp. B35(2025)]
MNFKCNKKLFVYTMQRNALVILLLVEVCVFFILVYYFIQPQIYRATLTFSLSDSAGKPLPIDKQNNVIAFLSSQSAILNYSSFQGFSSDGFHKNFYENIHFFRNGDLIDLTFEAKTAEAAQKGLETYFSAFSEAIIKKNQKLLLEGQQIGQQYNNTAILNIIQKFRLSITSFIHHDAKQTELNDLYAQLTKATLDRIHLTSLISIIKMMRENGKSLLPLSFIANNSAITALESKRNLLETQIVHMAAQLGWEHPQIKALTAESKALSNQLENKILQIVHQIHSDEIIARNFEEQLRKRISLVVKDQSQSLSQMLNKLENEIKAVVNAQNKEISKSHPLQNIKISVVSSTTPVPISFITLHRKNIIVGIFASLIIFGGVLLLSQQYFRTKKSLLEEGNFKNNEDVLVFKGIKSFEALITIEGFSDLLKWNASTVISIIGSEAAQMAAKLSLHLIEKSKTILLVDISGQQIEKVIGPHRGLSDILAGKVQLQDVVYHDYDTGVDILPQGLTSIDCVQDLSKNIPIILQEFKKNYDFVILEIASEPKYGLEQFAKLTDYYICSIALNEQDWMVQMVNKFPKTIYRVVAL